MIKVKYNIISLISQLNVQEQGTENFVSLFLIVSICTLFFSMLFSPSL